MEKSDIEEKKENPFALQIKNDDDEKYKLKIDYQNSNPFIKILIGGGVTTGLGAAAYAGGAFLMVTGTTKIALLSGLSTVYGGLISTGIGALLIIPGIIGTISYLIYKKTKGNKFKEFYEKLTDIKNEEMKEEREIYSKIIEEIDKFFTSGYKFYYDTIIKDSLIDSTSKIIKNLFKIKAELIQGKKENEKLKILEEKIKSLAQKVNVILIGRTGVGKSTLINSILKLKQEKRAKIGEGVDPMKIEGGWPKKYPIDDNDCERQGINLFDTEGIEIDNKSTNSINNHKDTIINFINKSYEEKKIPINCIWFCLHGNRLEECEKKYIKDLIDAFTEKKNLSTVPIFFVYTQAYQADVINIEKMEEALNELNCIKTHKKEIKIIDVIAEKKKRKDRRGKDFCEEEYNLDKLINETYNCSSSGFHYIINYYVNDYIITQFNSLSEKIGQFYFKAFKEIIESQGELKDMMNIIKQKNKEFIDIVYEVDINGRFNELFLKEVNEYLDMINKLFDKIKDKKYEELNELFLEKETLQTITKIFIYQKYEEKKLIDKKFNDYFEEINDYIILPMSFRKKNYSLYSMFCLFYTDILNITGQEINNLMQNKFQETIKKMDDLNNLIVKEYSNQFNPPLIEKK